MDFDRAYGRLSVFMACFAVAGAIGAFYLRGAPGGMGFSIGAAFAVANFRWIKQLTAALGANGKGPPKQMWRAVLFGGRYLLFGTVCYGIVKVFGINVLAVLAGLFVAAAAVLLEIIYELIYARA